MFFSLIRAPNQLSPKTKVVDFLFLYNFYFGQISSSNINYFFEFWIVKFGSKSFKCVHCASLTTGPACHLLVSSRSSRIVSVLKSSTAPLLFSLSLPRLSLSRASAACLHCCCCCLRCCRGTEPARVAMRPRALRRRPSRRRCTPRAVRARATPLLPWLSWP